MKYPEQLPSYGEYKNVGGWSDGQREGQPALCHNEIFFFFKMCVYNSTIRALTVNNACIINFKFQIQ